MPAIAGFYQPCSFEFYLMILDTCITDTWTDADWEDAIYDMLFQQLMLEEEAARRMMLPEPE